MARIKLEGDEGTFDEPVLVEGFPGVGLVGKIATDHLVDELELEYYASVHCDGLPQVGVYHGDGYTVRPPVRLYASEDHDLLALQSDVPISAGAVSTVADCLTGWIEQHDVLPVYLSGLPSGEEETQVRGIATGERSATRLEAVDVDPPGEAGLVSGPSGALLNLAAERDVDAIGLVVDTDPRFPDPESARVLIERGVEPLTDVEVAVDSLVEQAQEIRDKREQLARQMQQAAEQESTQARPIGMYQ